MSEGADIYYEISDRDKLHFRRIVLDNLAQAASVENAENDSYDGIGRLAEKQMHSAIKSFICPDTSKHEVKISSTPFYLNKDTGSKRPRGYIADIMDGNTVYEIQTAGFSPLRNKINWILENTTCNVVVIHPIVQTKWVSKLTSDGKITGRRKSPVHGRVEDIADQLYFFSDFLTSPRFSLVLITMEAEQYVRPERRRGRSNKLELIPVSLIGAYVFKNICDYKFFIPNTLPEPFTVKDYSKHTKIYGMKAYSIVNTLTSLGLLKQTDPIGRARAYIRGQ